MSPQFSMTIYTASTWVLPVLLAITLHEAAHGYVAHHLGDDTAWQLGRVSFNPLRHVDQFGTVPLPALVSSTSAEGRHEETAGRRPFRAQTSRSCAARPDPRRFSVTRPSTTSIHC